MFYPDFSTRKLFNSTDVAVRLFFISTFHPSLNQESLGSSPFPDVGLPGEGAESGFVATNNPALGHIPADGRDPAPGIVDNGAPVDGGVGKVVLQQGGHKEEWWPDQPGASKILRNLKSRPYGQDGAKHGYAFAPFDLDPDPAFKIGGGSIYYYSLTSTRRPFQLTYLCRKTANYKVCCI